MAENKGKNDLKNKGGNIDYGGKIIEYIVMIVKT